MIRMNLEYEVQDFHFPYDGEKQKQLSQNFLNDVVLRSMMMMCNC